VGLSDWALGLLIFGLGIKAGLVLLHVWLPLAHPAAPAPASAVLSGAMIKAALLGWLRFLPLGEEALWGWGHLLTLLGSITIIYALLVGLVQTNPKVVLAYSSVSKMGLMTALLGLALSNPALTPALLTALVMFATHHALVKGALFLGVGVAHASPARWVLPALAIPALALAGAPFTSGALAKQLLEVPVRELQGAWATAMPVILTLAALGTTLLMARFLTLMARQSKHPANAASWIAAPWLLLLGLILGLPFVSPYALPSIIAGWPLAAGVLLVLIWLAWLPGWSRRLPGIIPAGDILVPLLSCRRWLWPHLAMAGHRASTGVRQAILAMRRPLRRQAGWTLALEDRLSHWPLAGVLLLSIGASLWLLTRLVT
jgi:formate hydrogenlyase subunit 3/multisubunit Na+/H+ antiporter MnhD subunit